MDESNSKLPVNAQQSTFDLVTPAMDIVKNNWKAFLVVNLFAVISTVLTILSIGQQKLDAEQQAQEFAAAITSIPSTELVAILGLSLVVVFIVSIIGIFFQAMNVNLLVKTTEGKSPELGELFKDGKKYFFKIFLLTIASSLIIIGGLILLIVPGIIALGRLFFAPYYMVDKDLSVGDALRASNEQAKKHGIEVWKAIGVVVLISVVASIFDFIPVIGALISLGVLLVVSVVPPLRYQQLKLPNYPQSVDSSQESIPSEPIT